MTSYLTEASHSSIEVKETLDSRIIAFYLWKKRKSTEEDYSSVFLTRISLWYIS